MTLSDRDRRILVILAVFLGVVVVYLLADWALGGDGAGSVTAKQEELRKIIGQYRTFQKTKAAFEQAEKAIKRASDFELLTELESLAQKAGVKEHIVAMDKKAQPKNPYYKEDSVEVRLDKITIVQLINYLYELEYSTKVIRVRELHAEVRYDNKDEINVRILVSKFSETKSGEA
ncbi:MAG: type II secretion system protein M [Deltaproteobacteria bacterium]|nr:type II secretion system protein M [Deltaproteobacteria bacterium]